MQHEQEWLQNWKGQTKSSSGSSIHSRCMGSKVYIPDHTCCSCWHQLAGWRKLADVTRLKQSRIDRNPFPIQTISDSTTLNRNGWRFDVRCDLLEEFTFDAQILCKGVEFTDFNFMRVWARHEARAQSAQNVTSRLQNMDDTGPEIHSPVVREYLNNSTLSSVKFGRQSRYFIKSPAKSFQCSHEPTLCEIQATREAPV